MVTQMELFRTYVEANGLFVNASAQAFWFEYGGQRVGRMNIDALTHAQLKL